MENDKNKQSSSEKRRNESSRGKTRERKGRPGFSESKAKKKTKSNSEKQDQSTMPSGEYLYGGSGGTVKPEEGREGEAANIPGDTSVHEQAVRVQGQDESQIKRDRSKSRSRSGSRSRFSSFFRRKKLSKSETNLSKDSNHATKKRSDSADNVKQRRRQNVLQVNDGLDSGDTEISHKSDLERTSQHRYDKRIQPRDRLRHMTVADAVREQELRRAGSVQRSSRPGEAQSSLEVPVSAAEVLSKSSPTLDSTFGVVEATGRGRPHQTRPPLTREQLCEEVSGFQKCLSSPEITQMSYDKTRVDSTGSTDVSDSAHVSRSQRDSMEQQPPFAFTSAESTQTNQRRNNSDDHERNKDIVFQQNGSIGNDEETMNLDTVKRIQGDDLHGPGPSLNATRWRRLTKEEIMKAKVKRQASLTKFLELRQTAPSSLSRTRRISQSSDSGVTSRDTSPSATTVQSHHSQQQSTENSLPAPLDSDKSTSPAPLDSDKSTNPAPLDSDKSTNPAPLDSDKSSNPYVISSVPISPAIITGPRLSVKETEVKDNELETIQTSRNRPNVLKLYESTGESSSISSSPQMNSMTSSFRSSDQGYIESGSDDDLSFSTPPEDVETPSAGKGEHRSRKFSAGTLKRLLEATQKEKQRPLFPELDLETWDAKRISVISNEDEKLEENQMAQGHYLHKKIIPKVQPKYMPRGVRRSKSDAESRYKSQKRLPHQLMLLDDTACSSKISSTAPEDRVSSNLGREKVKFDLDSLSATSTTTLTNQGSSDFLNRAHVTSEASDHKLVPVMGTEVHRKYRRTFSPPGSTKAIHTSKDQKSIKHVPDVVISPSNVIPKDDTSSFVPSSIHFKLDHDRPGESLPATLLKVEPSPPMPKKGILKSPTRDRHPLSQENKSPTTQKHLLSQENKSPISQEHPLSQENKSPTTQKHPLSQENKSPTTQKHPLSQENKSPTTQKHPLSQENKSPTTQKHPLSQENKSPTTQKHLLSQEIKSPTTQKEDVSPDVQFKETLHLEEPVSKHTSHTTALSAPVSPCTDSVRDISVQAVTPESRSAAVKSSTTRTQLDFPLIHGLEIGMHKVASFSGYSLTDYLQEQSRVNWRKQTPSPARKDTTPSPARKDKTPKSSKLSPKKKETAKEENEKKIDNSTSAMKDIADKDVKPSVPSEYTVKRNDQSKFTTMIDKECQTSAWLINSLIRKRSSKTKKKGSAFYKKKKQHRRGSSASDTFIPIDPKKHRESYQRSSLDDIKIAHLTESGYPKRGEIDLALPSRVSKHLSEKRFKAKRGGEDPVSGESSSKTDAGSKSNDTSDVQKPKKLSLTAVILLKNRLAKYRERKRNEKAASSATAEEEPAMSRVPSETMITIENELNFSKLEVSKETDIIDDDLYEPEFSLGYTRKQLRFDDLPDEPMQSEEPLPPLPYSTHRRMRQRRESTLRERKRKCVQYIKRFIAFLFSHIGLCSLVVAYTIMGGFIFRALENQAEYTVRRTIRERRDKVIDHLVSLAVKFEKTERGMENFTGEVNDTILNHQVFIHGMTKDKGWDGVEGFDEEGLWTFASSLLYAITVTTTIGYGHVAPKTPEGRIVTIGYAVVGIPLTLLCLTNIGDVMATGFRLLYGKICCGVCCNLFKPRRRRIQVDLEKGLGGTVVTTEEEQPDKPKEVIHVPTSLCLLLIAAYIFAGAMLFSMWESWDILTGSYFCFITLSTIGFGDIVPGMDSNAWAAEEKLVLCALYLVLGLSLIAMCFNLVQEDVKAKCRWLGMKIGIVEKIETPI